jgi:hypothetical protein
VQVVLVKHKNGDLYAPRSGPECVKLWKSSERKEFWVKMVRLCCHFATL